jgi:hypothetical protein
MFPPKAYLENMGQRIIEEGGWNVTVICDGVEMNKDMKVIECPRCGNKDFSDTAKFCKICGMQVYNYCEGEPRYDCHGNVVDICSHKNSGDARFCEICGTPTVFFLEELIRPWQVLKNEHNAEQPSVENWGKIPSNL